VAAAAATVGVVATASKSNGEAERESGNAAKSVSDNVTTG
jgi:hypothetical protein